MTAGDELKLLLVDDHPVVRDGLHRIQVLEPRIRIVAEADTLASAIEAARRIGPEIILMDVRLPDGDGIAACRQIKAFLPETHILFLTSFADNHLVLAAMEAGADGYLLKESGARRIVEAIHSILGGRSVFDPVPRPVSRSPRGPEPANPLAALAARERRVLAQVAQGKTDKEVAVILGLSTKTARNYLDRIFAKLNVHTRTEAALLYTRFEGGQPDSILNQLGERQDGGGGLKSGEVGS